MAPSTPLEVVFRWYESITVGLVQFEEDFNTQTETIRTTSFQTWNYPAQKSTVDFQSFLPISTSGGCLHRMEKRPLGGPCWKMCIDFFFFFLTLKFFGPRPDHCIVWHCPSLTYSLMQEIFHTFYMDLSRFLLGFVKVVTLLVVY